MQTKSLSSLTEALISVLKNVGSSDVLCIYTVAVWPTINDILKWWLSARKLQQHSLVCCG